MIELNQDKLTFSQPATAEATRQNLETYLQTHLPRILAQNPARAWKKATQNDWRLSHVSQEKRAALFRQHLTPLDKDRVAQSFRQKVFGQAYHALHPKLSVNFQRTLRIPDNHQTHGLPPGLGTFPLRHLDDFAERVPTPWRQRGGVLMPMYQAEAMWIRFNANYPFALKIAAGKINAVSGQTWQRGLHHEPQDYVIVPDQPWLDGFAVAKGVIRQFVAMPLGDGYSVEEQLTGRAEFGGLQLEAFPMKAETYFRKELEPKLPRDLADFIIDLLPPQDINQAFPLRIYAAPLAAPCGMGLGAGGKMRQEIYQDPHGLDAWDTSLGSRCFVHLCDALVWREITGSNPPHPPVTAQEYSRWGFPWFDYYRDDLAVLEGSKKLAKIKSIGAISRAKQSGPAQHDQPVEISDPIHIGPTRRPGQVTEWDE